MTALSDLPLFARTGDPATSHAAARSMRHEAGAQRLAILAALHAHGPATADALDERCGFRPTTSGRRLIELERMGMVLPTQVTRRTRSGRDARVYRVAR